MMPVYGSWAECNGKLSYFRRIVHNRIKMLSQLNTLNMGKRARVYDDDFRAHILFSC